MPQRSHTHEAPTPSTLATLMAKGGAGKGNRKRHKGTVQPLQVAAVSALTMQCSLLREEVKGCTTQRASARMPT